MKYLYLYEKAKKVPLCNTGKNVDNLDTTIVEYLEG